MLKNRCLLWIDTPDRIYNVKLGCHGTGYSHFFLFLRLP